MRWIIVFAAFFMAALPVRAMGAEPVASIPYRLDFNGWYTVDVEINGSGPYKFIVDTGATLTAVFESIPISQDFAPANQPDRRVLGIIGAQTLPSVTIGDLKIAGLEMNDHVSVVIPDWDTPGDKPHGILGLDFLTRYTVLFDAERMLIELYSPDNPPTDIMAEMSRTRMRHNTFNRGYGGLYTITLNIAGRRIHSIVDLGADGTILNYRAMRRLLGGVYIAPGRLTGTSTGSKLRDVFGDETRALSILAGPTKIGNARWGRMTFIVFNAGIFKELGVTKLGYGLLGADLLRDRNFIFDFANERFYITHRAVIPGV